MASARDAPSASRSASTRDVRRSVVVRFVSASRSYAKVRSSSSVRSLCSSVRVSKKMTLCDSNLARISSASSERASISFRNVVSAAAKRARSRAWSRSSSDVFCLCACSSVSFKRSRSRRSCCKASSRKDARSVSIAARLNASFAAASASSRSARIAFASAAVAADARMFRISSACAARRDASTAARGLAASRGSPEAKRRMRGFE